MKNLLLLAVASTALSLSSCSHEKTTESTTTTETTMPADNSAMSAADTDAMIEARAQRIADKMVADMKITDQAQIDKIRAAYASRGKRMRDMRTKYAADTAGMAMAMREANMATDTEFKTIFVEPTQYQSYETARPMYDESNYMDDNASSMAPAEDAAAGTGSTDNTMANDNMSADNSGSNMSADNSGTVEKGKMKMADGSKIKIKDDGKVKTKDADGNKMK